MFGCNICQNPPGRFRRFNRESYFSRWKEIFPLTTNLSPTAAALWLGLNLFYLLHYRERDFFSSFLACASVGLHPLKYASFSASSKPSERDLCEHDVKRAKRGRALLLFGLSRRGAPQSFSFETSTTGRLKFESWDVAYQLETIFVSELVDSQQVGHSFSQFATRSTRS